MGHGCTCGSFAGAALPALSLLPGGARSAAGWWSALQLAGLSGALGAFAGLVFQFAYRWRSGALERRATSRWLVDIGGIAAAVVALGVTLPELTKDRSCHNVLRDGQRSLPAVASFEVRAPRQDWLSVAEEVTGFAAERGWSVRSDVRPEDPYPWFLLSICDEAGTNMLAIANGNAERVHLSVYQPQGGEGWRAPARELLRRISHDWEVEAPSPE